MAIAGRPPRRAAAFTHDLAGPRLLDPCAADPPPAERIAKEEEGVFAGGTTCIHSAGINILPLQVAKHRRLE